MELVDKRPKDWTSQKSPKYTLKKTTLLVNKASIKSIISHWHQLENDCELGQFDHYINSLQNRSVVSPYVFPYSIWPNTLIHQENGINDEAAICVYVQNLCRKIAASLLIAYSRGIKMIRCPLFLCYIADVIMYDIDEGYCFCIFYDIEMGFCGYVTFYIMRKMHYMSLTKKPNQILFLFVIWQKYNIFNVSNFRKKNEHGNVWNVIMDT